MTGDRFTVEDRPEQSRYVLLDHESGTGEPAEIGEESYVDVTGVSGPDRRVLFHTGVSDDYTGQGLASVLVRAAVEDVIAGGRLIVPVCPYVKTWLPKHPQYADHVTAVLREHLRAVREQQAG